MCVCVCMRHLDWGCMYDSPSNTWPPQQEAVYLIMRESVRDTQGASSRERCTKKTTTNSSSRYLTTHTHTHASCLPFPTANHMRGREIIIFSVKLNRWWQLRKKKIKIKLQMQMCLFVSFSASISCHRSGGFTGAVTLSSLEATHESNLGHLIDGSLPSP